MQPRISLVTVNTAERQHRSTPEPEVFRTTTQIKLFVGFIKHSYQKWWFIQDYYLKPMFKKKITQWMTITNTRLTKLHTQPIMKHASNPDFTHVHTLDHRLLTGTSFDAQAFPKWVAGLTPVAAVKADTETHSTATHLHALPAWREVHVLKLKEDIKIPVHLVHQLNRRTINVYSWVFKQQICKMETQVKPV